MRRRLGVLSLCLISACAASPDPEQLPPAPAGLAGRVSTYLEATRKYPQHVWRDTSPMNADGTVNGYIEIPRGESTKWEFDIPLNRREVDRMIPSSLGGYPINYGFIPQTVSYDGDPADILVLGPPLEGGSLVKGQIVALMGMTDTGDLDSKVVVSLLDANGRPAHELTDADKERLAQFFDTYKNHDGKATKVTGWGDAAAARKFLDHTAGFFAGATR